MSVFFAFFFGAIGNFKNNDVCLKISGGFNIFIGINTFYMGTALLLIGVYGRTILPLFAPGEKIHCSE
jgi:succinate-acetate transporter protein